MISSGCSGVTSAKGNSTTSTNAASLSINTPALPGAITQTAYTGALSATGGITPYTWSITSGSLPPGLNLNSSSGAITGTPTTAGTFTFTAQAKDSSPTPQTATASASVLTVDLLQITTTSLPDPQMQTSYSATLTASGGMTPYLWSISSGSLPPGLSLDSSTGVISGVPTSTGSYAFTVEVSDPPSVPQKSKKNLNTTVQPKSLQITATGLPSGQLQAAYSAVLAATGGTTPYSWTVSAGSLPGGLSLNSSTGAISGTPTQSGTFSFTAQVTDSVSHTAQQALNITVNAAAVAPSITTQPSSQTITAGQTATFSVTASGTTPLSYQWSKNGTAISAATSSSYTTPAETTSDNGALFTVVVSNSAGSVTSNAAALAVNAPPGALTPSTTSLSFGNVIVSNSSVLGVNFTNSGSVNITVSSVTISGPGFTASGVSNGQIITPGQVVTLNITFAPAATVSVTGNVTVASNASNSPTSISLSGSGVLAHSATLSWTASTSTIIGYNVYRGPVSGGPYTLVNSSLVAGTQYVDSSALAGQTYYYVATAVASGNVESTYSNQVSATIPTP